MRYRKFRKKLLSVLQDFYGQDAEVVILKLVQRDGRTEYGILIRFSDTHLEETPVICLKEFYRWYCRKGTFDKCVGKIIELRGE